MARLSSKTSPCLIFLFMMALMINQSSSARTLEKSTPTNHNRQNHHHDHSHHKITFLMRDIFNATATKSSSTTKLTSSSTTHKLPFSKPLGLFPPKRAVLLPESDMIPATATGSSPSQTLDLPGIGLSFPAKATLKELDLGILTSIEEDIFHPLGYETYGSQLLGKAQGMHVVSSEDGIDSHMMALTVKFAHSKSDNHQVENGLRFFGVKRSHVNESHIAVIGGIGKYKGANGYATVKVVNVRPSSVLGENKLGAGNKLLKFSVYLS